MWSSLCSTWAGLQGERLPLPSRPWPTSFSLISMSPSVATYHHFHLVQHKYIMPYFITSLCLSVSSAQLSHSLTQSMKQSIVGFSLFCNQLWTFQHRARCFLETLTVSGLHPITGITLAIKGFQGVEEDFKELTWTHNVGVKWSDKFCWKAVCFRTQLVCCGR